MGIKRKAPTSYTDRYDERKRQHDRDLKNVRQTALEALRAKRAARNSTAPSTSNKMPPTPPPSSSESPADAPPPTREERLAERRKSMEKHLVPKEAIEMTIATLQGKKYRTRGGFESDELSRLRGMTTKKALVSDALAKYLHLEAAEKEYEGLKEPENKSLRTKEFYELYEEEFMDGLQLSSRDIGIPKSARRIAGNPCAPDYITVRTSKYKSDVVTNLFAFQGPCGSNRAREPLDFAYHGGLGVCLPTAESGKCFDYLGSVAGCVPKGIGGKSEERLLRRGKAKRRAARRKKLEEREVAHRKARDEMKRQKKKKKKKSSKQSPLAAAHTPQRPPPATKSSSHTESFPRKPSQSSIPTAIPSKTNTNTPPPVPFKVKSTAQCRREEAPARGHPSRSSHRPIETNTHRPRPVEPPGRYTLSPTLRTTAAEPEGRYKLSQTKRSTALTGAVGAAAKPRGVEKRSSKKG